ncbi:unnamed protein product, partial [Amoebophrya sp. A120]|eukprot:GSA120T00022608001.1
MNCTSIRIKYPAKLAAYRITKAPKQRAKHFSSQFLQKRNWRTLCRICPKTEAITQQLNCHKAKQFSAERQSSLSRSIGNIFPGKSQRQALKQEDNSPRSEMEVPG